MLPTRRKCAAAGRAHASPLPASPPPEPPPPGEAGAPSGRDGRRRWLAALLIPGPLASELDGLRRALASSSLGRIPPHLTLVPPRNMTPAEQAAAPAHVRAVAATAGPLRLVLGPPDTFAPRTPVVFLAVGGDVEELVALRRKLAIGPLAPPAGREDRDFVPHVTLCGDAGEERARSILEAISAYRVEVTIDRVTLLEQDESAPRRPWSPFAEAVLGRPAVVGRGGVELELRLARRLDHEEAAWFEAEWAAYSEAMWGPGFVPDEPVVLVARDVGAVAAADPGGRIVGVALGSLRPDTLHVRRLVVGRGARRQGVGTQLMRALERLAVESGCTRIRLETADGGLAQRFYEDLGFAAVAIVPGHRQGRNFAVMERRL